MSKKTEAEISRIAARLLATVVKKHSLNSDEMLAVCYGVDAAKQVMLFASQIGNVRDTVADRVRYCRAMGSILMNAATEAEEYNESETK